MEIVFEKFFWGFYRFFHNMSEPTLRLCALARETDKVHLDFWHIKTATTSGCSCLSINTANQYC